MKGLSLIPIEGIPLVTPGDDLAELIYSATLTREIRLESGDIIAICQKIVSKAEGNLMRLDEVEPSALALNFAAAFDKDPRLVEVVLRQSERIVRMERGVLITQTGAGWVCANAGVDESNSPEDGLAVLLPKDPDASACHIRERLRALADVEVSVLITDTFGRPWRDGQTEVCLGIAGLAPIKDLRGATDMRGRILHHTMIAVADELASAAGLLMEKAGGIPAVLIRGYHGHPGGSGKGARELIRTPESDLFR
jgi:coenzyme F420-0:L-glutamate ligase/coenzyme F420-1:gamma-L-glutamate ligase